MAMAQSIFESRRIEEGILEVVRASEEGWQAPFGLTANFARDKREIESLDDDFSSIAGSTCIKESDIGKFLCRVLDTKVPESIVKRRISSLILDKKLARIKTDDGNLIYRKNKLRVELESAKLITEMLTRTLPDVDKIYEKMYRAEAELGMKLSHEQEEAVVTALTHPFSVITGGPGTGKTSVQRVLIETYEWLVPNGETRLCAPTGQAAKRMTESTGYEASTIHSALGIMLGASKLLNDKLTLDEGLIIIDESSMIDAELFHTLLKHIGKNSRLVLVGDIDQLPSIGAGCVLRELIKSDSVPVARLTQVFRQESGSAIAINAKRIKVGETALVSGDGYTFLDADKNDIVDYIKNVYKTEVDAYGLDNTICLTSYRRFTDTGVNALNETLREAVRDDITAETPSVIVNDTVMYQGDKVLYLRNAKGLVNGDVGIIQGIKGDKLSCSFSGKAVTLDESDYKYLDLAYVQTIHKAQGAEYKSVILVCDKEHEKILKRGRSLIYTGLTRAKENCTVIGDRKVFDNAIADKGNDENPRLSNLAAFIDQLA